MDTSYVPLGPPGPDGRQRVRYEQSSTVLRDGMLYALRVTGTAELVRGPLGRIRDLCDQLEAEGLTVPSRILDALAAEEEGISP